MGGIISEDHVDIVEQITDEDVEMVEQTIDEMDDGEIKTLLGDYFRQTALKMRKKAKNKELAQKAGAEKKRTDNRRKNKVARKARRRNRK